MRLHLSFLLMNETGIKVKGNQNAQIKFFSLEILLTHRIHDHFNSFYTWDLLS